MNSPKIEQLKIKRIMETDNKYFLGRIAGVELKVAYHILSNEGVITQKDLIELENNAGIHTKNMESLKEYSKKLMESYDNCTMIGEWEDNGVVYLLTGVGQEWIRKRTGHIPKIDARALEPYYFKESWMESIKGKRILIVHPFIHTFQKQLENLKEIFPNRSWFEDCTFQFIKPPLTLAGNHQNIDWQQHLQPFLDSLHSLSTFDIALIGAGGYGMLISNYIFTELNKSVIYIGGALQLFFGVIGKRWFSQNEVLQLVNDYWIRPDSSDKPIHFSKVEKGCYW